MGSAQGLFAIGKAFLIFLLQILGLVATNDMGSRQLRLSVIREVVTNSPYRRGVRLLIFLKKTYW